MTARFEVGKTYGTRCIGDHNIIYTVTVTKRTDKTVTIVGDSNKRCKIHIDNNGDEFIIPERYSMAPVFRATKEVE